MPAWSEAESDERHRWLNHGVLQTKYRGEKLHWSYRAELAMGVETGPRQFLGAVHNEQEIHRLIARDTAA